MVIEGSASSPTRNSSKVANRWRVLVVDDDAHARRALEKLLVITGYAVSTASDGEEALVETRRSRPDVVLTDLRMPRMGGVELCARLHEIDEELPVIVMTARADMQSVLESLRQRAEDFLTKPIELDAVIWRVERAMARRTAKLGQEEVRRALNLRLVEQAEAETRLRAQLNALLENLSEGVVIAAPSGRVLMINDAARAILGLAEGELTLDALSSLETLDLEGRRLGLDQRPLVRALRGESFTDCEVVSVRPSGDRRRVSSTGASVSDRDGNVALAIVVLHDMTEQRHHEQQRAEYLALVSHDLRNPLGVVLMSLSLLNEQADDCSGPASHAFRAQLVHRAERNAKRIASMLEELTESTKLESNQIVLRLAACELRGAVDRVVDSIDDSGGRRMSVASDDTPPYVVQADAPQLERAIANLITNALKYSAKSASVSIRLAHEGGNVVLEVTDRGIGIVPESVSRLFEQYYRTEGGKASAGGLGLGLYIARMIVEAHGGRIDVVSELGRGSTFRLTLPSYVGA